MIRKNVHGSKVLNTELKTKIFVKGALRAVDHQYTDFKFFVVLMDQPPFSDLDFPKHSHVVIIRWENQYVLCSDVVKPIQKWINRNNLKPICKVKQEDMKRITQRHKAGTYRQYSNNTLHHRETRPDQASYDPLLERAQELMKKYDVEFGVDPYHRRKRSQEV